VKYTVNGATPFVGLALIVALSGGGVDTEMVFEAVAVRPALSCTVRVAVNVPTVAYLCEGLCVEEIGVWSPKSHE